MATIVGMFAHTREANTLIDELMKNGFTKNQIGVVARHEVLKESGLDFGTGAEVGAITGATTGGIAGLLIGLGALVIPGIGPVIAAGEFLTWVGATVLGLAAGAVAGGLIGSLAGFGLSETQAQRYSEGVKSGHILVTVQAPTERAQEVAELMRSDNALEVDIAGGEPVTFPAAAAAAQQPPMTAH